MFFELVLLCRGLCDLSSIDGRWSLVALAAPLLRAWLVVDRWLEAALRSSLVVLRSLLLAFGSSLSGMHARLNMFINLLLLR